MSKKAQQSHIFIYIFSVVAAGLVLLFGYFVIENLSELNEESKIANFGSELAKNFRVIKDGDVKVVKIDMPTNIKEVCFVDVDKIISENSPVVSAGLSAMQPIIADGIKDGIENNAVSKDNLFLINKKNNIEFSDDIGNIDIGGPNWYCKSVEQGILELRLEGKGDSIGFTNFS